MNQELQHNRRLATLNVTPVLMLIAAEVALEVNGLKIGTGGLRLRTFLKGTTCVSCGLEASFFAVEAIRLDPRYILNLYGITKSGKEVLMTSDHIFPKSLGGTGELKNRQPMCFPCNQAKGIKPGRVQHPELRQVKMEMWNLLKHPENWSRTSLAQTSDGYVVAPHHPLAKSFSLVGAMSHCYLRQGELWSPEYEFRRSHLQAVIVANRVAFRPVIQQLTGGRKSTDRLQLFDFNSNINFEQLTTITETMAKTERAP